jgi:uncharacterized cupredoxin-like copper-binding protein
MRRAVPLVATCLLLAGCGGYSSKKSTTQGSAGFGPPLKTISVSEAEFKITPSSIHLDKTGVYSFKVTNNGQITHIFEIEGPGLENETGEIQPGSTKTLTLRLTAGNTYETYCPIDDHKAKGMKGSLTVGKAAGGGTPTTTNETTTGGGYGY